MVKGYVLKFNLIILFLVFACRQEDPLFDEDRVDTEYSQEASMAHLFYANIYQICRNEVEYIESTDAISTYKTEEQSSHDSCATISYYLDSLNTCVTHLNIFYNDTNCSSTRRKKYGKLKVYLTGKLNETGTLMTIIPEGFFISGKKIEGTIQVNNVGFNENYQYELVKEVIDGKICINSNEYFLWNSTSSIFVDFIEQVMLFETESRAVNRYGRTYSVQTLEPLLSQFGCKYFQQGELEIESNWGLYQILDFGEGYCDDKADLYQEMNSVEIDLN